jgi:hypothetical protein
VKSPAAERNRGRERERNGTVKSVGLKCENATRETAKRAAKNGKLKARNK